MQMFHVNPTRMELLRLKKRVKTARRGHRLLKDKRDELMKQFLERVRLSLDLRESVETSLLEVHTNFRTATVLMSPEILNQSLMLPKQTINVELTACNIMSVNVPEYALKTRSKDPNDNYPYGFLMTSGDLDDAILGISTILPELLKLAELEKSIQIMALEIEKTRRRVNALEYVIIPQLVDSIRTITMKLDEIERGNLTRLMKVKDILLEQARGDN